MCTDCFDDPSDDEADAPNFAPGEIAQLARHIEADMSGERVPPHAWAIYFGKESGALDWRALERIARAMDGARLVASMAHG